ncbi:MAG: hypothetical protein CL670_10400 [Balneola sp.]|jgi:hypothetical protein|nr:hypothetical protein [Balneola sp.]MBE79554.1 hypothetical protein [Balneola sp.]HBX65847.1 hypothetical protein [Balneolaceae bacterium]|tara:strand:+ start:90 stop:476 length:387 start_codon:yes stop_codon:yes gene_type:complete
MRKNQNDKEDEVFRSASINAWIQSKMERDKALLTLSSGGVGLLVTFLQFKENIAPCHSMLYYIAFISFTLCIASVIVIFSRNAKYIEKLLSSETRKNDKVLGFFDYMAVLFFSIGILFTIIIGVININ